MNNRELPVTEDELHAYVDGELPADRRGAVETWVASHPDDATRVAAWREQISAIRACYGGIVDEPTPARLALDRLPRRHWPWRAVAAAIVFAFLSGGAAGWLVRGASAT